MSDSVLYEAHPAMFRNQPIGFVVCVVLCFIGVGLLIFAVWWLRVLGTTLTVTRDRTILRRGILSKSTNEVFHSDVRNVRIYQSFMQRLFGVGEIGISSAGQSGMEIVVVGIPNPDQVKQIIDENRDRR